jgi:hypothetical protein
MRTLTSQPAGNLKASSFGWSRVFLRCPRAPTVVTLCPGSFQASRVWNAPHSKSQPSPQAQRVRGVLFVTRSVLFVARSVLFVARSVLFVARSVLFVARSVLFVARSVLFVARSLSDCSRYFVSINRELKPLLHVLRHEYKGIQGYTPTNIQGVHEIGPHLLAFSQKWKDEGCPPLLACTLDVERAFDTVNQDRCVPFCAYCV